MYWILVSALGAFSFFYVKGRKMKKQKTEFIEPAADDFEAPSTGTQDPLSPEDLYKTLKTVSDAITRHDIYTQCVDMAYKKRSGDQNMRERVVTWAEAYIKEFPDLKNLIFEQLKNAPDQVLIFRQLAIVFEENQEYEKAMDICEKAMAHGLSDGTKTGYTGRIKRLKRKMDKQLNESRDH